PSCRVLSLLQDSSVRYNGEPIAVVVAETLEQATHASSLVRPTYHIEAPAADLATALPTAKPYTQEILGSIPPAVSRGDLTAGSAWSHVVLAAMAARMAGRPVKLVLSRRQMFGLVGARPHTVQHVSIGARNDGTLTAVRHDATSSTSTFEEWLEPSTLQTRMLY